LLNIAPHLVWPRSFLFPVHRGGRLSAWKLEAGLWLYDLLAVFRNVRLHRMLSKRGMLHAEPGIRARDLVGGARYYDAQCDDARLTLANVRDAHRHGAVVSNYAKVDHLDSADGRVNGARVMDLTTGETVHVRALVTVNATGPWSDQIREPDGRPSLLRTKGVHVVVPRHRLGNHEAVIFVSPIDGRVMFVLPWGSVTYIGTTETEMTGDPGSVAATADDVVYVLRSANALFPEARLTPDDVLATWAGVRPLLRHGDQDDPNAASREHTILESDNGLLSIVGGKLTTYRLMAAQIVDRVTSRLHERDGRQVAPRSPTDREPLPGGEARNLDVMIDATVVEGFSREVATHLVHTYGGESAAVVRLAQSEPRLAEPVITGHTTIWAELLYAMRREMAITLTDLLMRRTHLFYAAPDQVLAKLDDLVRFAAAELRWTSEREGAEAEAYRFEVRRSRAFREALGPDPL
ncbi:MAG: glycerol-3-phosphate dehydrogenase/oxidase, partial [Gemmatimonadales bacterium]|nr:glycerol-3-phosphate dehydrogenase/oxidase [Gemmatimonadales bacterium]